MICVGNICAVNCLSLWLVTYHDLIINLHDNQLETAPQKLNNFHICTNNKKLWIGIHVNKEVSWEALCSFT